MRTLPASNAEECLSLEYWMRQNLLLQWVVKSLNSFVLLHDKHGVDRTEEDTHLRTRSFVLQPTMILKKRMLPWKAGEEGELNSEYSQTQAVINNTLIMERLGVVPYLRHHLRIW